MPMIEYGTVHIVSDGNPEHTRILAPDGSEIRHVRSFEIHAEVGELTTVDLTLVAVRFDIDATVKTVRIECPICTESMVHECRTKSWMTGL